MADKKQMTEVQKKFVELEKKKKEYRDYFDQLQQAIQDVSNEIGIDGMFQDDDGTVYQIVIPDGRFIYYEKVGYIRTRRTDEARGDLSLKKAQEAGYEVK